MKWILFFLMLVPALLGQVHGDIETQIDVGGNSRYLSAIVTEQVGETFFMQRFFPAQGRVTRYELGAGWIFRISRIGPCQEFRVQPYSGWAREENDYLVTSGLVSAKCGGHKVQVIVDRKNGDTSFQYNRVTIGVYKHLSFRWDGFYKSGWLANQLGGEVEVVERPLGKVQCRHVAGTRYDFILRRWIFQYAFRF